MATLENILTWDAAAIGAVADTLVQRRSDLTGLQDELDDGAPPASWSSEAGVLAAAEHARLKTVLSDLVAELSLAATAVDIAAVAVRAARRDLEGALEVAKVYNLGVNRTTGAVFELQCLPEDADDQDRQALLNEVADRIEQAWRNANHADQELAQALLAVHEGNVSGGDGTLADAATTGALLGGRDILAPPAGDSPSDQNAWWNGLTPEEQEAVIADHPEWIGGTDGIPAWARDGANRALLGDFRTDLQDERAALQARIDGLGFFEGWRLNGLENERDVLDEKLAALDEVEKTMALPGRQLLVLDTTGPQTRAAIAVGDLDTAAHVAVFTPGFTTTVQDSMVDTTTRMEELQARSTEEVRRTGDLSGTVATVAWIGYEAPQWDGVIGGGSVLSDDLAVAGARDLADFYRGVDASRAIDPHLTALGHSYGSLTTGLALQEQTGVDDMVVFGSPGIGTSDVDELDVRADHVYRVEARQDAVADGGMFGIDPSHMEGVTGLSAQEETIGGVEYNESVGHSDYLTDESTSQHNLAVIIAGGSDRLSLDEGRGAGDVISWPVPGTY